jgi:hypothetical protein
MPQRKRSKAKTATDTRREREMEKTVQKSRKVLKQLAKGGK